jgi:16S rRNA (guanine966-N2)-methyltransferase
VRIIAGRLKGRQLKTPTWDGLRPTSDRLRETLFNILAPRIQGARVLDGYAGTGAVGIEAISRGAAHVTFVEQNRRALALIEANLAACRVEEGYTIEGGELVAVLRRRSADAQRETQRETQTETQRETEKEALFDLIFLDPPYDIAETAPMLDAAARMLTPDGLVVVERATRRELEMPSSLTRVRDVRSGDSTLTFLKGALPERSAGSPADNHDATT